MQRLSQYLQQINYNRRPAINIIERLLATWAPHTCLQCGRDGFVLCPDCRRQLPGVAAACYRCQRVAGFRTCHDCRGTTPLVAVAALTAYRGAGKELVGRLKFQYARTAADEMAELMAARFASVLAVPGTALVPVPTASRRVRQRGYDQAVLLARALAKRSPARCELALVRHGQSQQHGASRRARVSGAGRHYTLRRSTRLFGRPVILIDDVLTTGATFESAATALNDAGASRITALAFARAELGRDA